MKTIYKTNHPNDDFEVRFLLDKNNKKIKYTNKELKGLTTEQLEFIQDENQKAKESIMLDKYGWWLLYE